MDVTTDNFKEIYPSIIDKLGKCAFVAFDNEFTGIRSEKHLQNSLFDTLDERYLKIKKCCEQTAITQFGISIFTFDREKYLYCADSYTFHLRPQCFAHIDQSYLLQASSLLFMIEHKFDFNKFLYKGICYLSRHEISTTKKKFSTKTLCYDDINMDINKEEYDLVQTRIAETFLWYNGTSSEQFSFEVDNPVQRYVIQKEILNKFSDLSTTTTENKVIFKKLFGEEKPEQDNEDKLFNHLLEELSGMAVVFEALVKSGKPVVGHNVLYDLALTYTQFIGPLPKRYETFKREMHNLLPCIYDTKHISHKLQSRFKMAGKDPWDFSSLENVYNYFNGPRGRYVTLYSPQIKINNLEESGKFHEAGWDSYCAGYIFVRLAHWQACEKRGTSQVLSLSDHLHALRPYSNAINLIRASRPFIILDKADPPGYRPDLLFIKTSDGSRINSNDVAQLLGRFGSMDIKKVNSTTLAIAIAGHNSARGVIECISKEKTYTISKFRTMNWTNLGKWTLGLTAVGTFAYFCLKYAK